MFIVKETLVYEVTKKSATDSLERILENKLTGKYNNKFLSEILEEIISYVEFPTILDDSRIFVFDEDSESFSGYILKEKPSKERRKYSIGDFSPKYNGVLMEETKEVFENYSLDILIGSRKGVKNAVINCFDDDCILASMDKNPSRVLRKALKDILENEAASKLADVITNKVFVDNIAFISFIKNSDEPIYYALRINGDIRKSSPFSVNNIYKSIMAELPNLKSISQKAKSVAIYAHNKIMYGIGITDYELVAPSGYQKNGVPIFTRIIDGMSFWIIPGNKYWRSDEPVSTTIGNIDWSQFNDGSFCEDTWTTFMDYTTPKYKDFDVEALSIDEAKKLFKKEGNSINILCNKKRREMYDGQNYRKYCDYEIYDYSKCHKSGFGMNYSKNLEFRYYNLYKQDTTVIFFMLSVPANIKE